MCLIRSCENIGNSLQPFLYVILLLFLYTDKKYNKIFLIYKETEGWGAKSYMTSGLLKYGEKFASFFIY